MNDRYESAKALYAGIGVDTDAAMEKVKNLPVSIHCWQGDDIGGFESRQAGASGGIATTGDHFGKARNPQELMADLDKALAMIPGKKSINLHAIYAITDENPERDELEPRHFAKWVEFAKARGLGLDMNPTFFSHPLAADGLTLSHPDEKIRKFWIRHAIACRRIAAYFGKELGIPSVHNIWIPDGYKHVPADRLGPRKRLKDSLDEIFAAEIDRRYLVDCVESKLFGIGVESYTVGSHEFYMNYAAKNDIQCLLDNGHFHPTEQVADKISAMLLFADKVALHVTHGVRWDSDHVVLLNDELRDIATEIVRCDALDKVLIGLDYFDASINRVSAWVVGTRNMKKALLCALLTPFDKLRKLQDEGDFSQLMVLQEELKSYPWSDVWDQLCQSEGVPVRESWYEEIRAYEDEVLAKRG